MTLLPWNDRLSVGMESIDAQHRMLVETLNELHHAVMRGAARDVTGMLLHTLLAYTRGHDAAEEAMMAKVNYPELKEHKALHRELLQIIEVHTARFERGEIAIGHEFLQYLRDWLTHHVQEVDAAYRPWIAEYEFETQAALTANQTSNESCVEANSGAGLVSEARS
jgi:hemerythrin